MSEATPSTPVAETGPAERIRRALTGATLDIEFQPVFDLRDRSILGVEALARFRQEPLRRPDLWFAEAMELGLGPELELTAFRKASAALPEMPESWKLFANVSPATLGTDAFLDAVAEAGGSRLVLEVAHSALSAEAGGLAATLRQLRRLGAAVAVDNAGRDGLEVDTVLSLGPDYVKLDMLVCRNIHRDPDRREAAASIVSAASAAGAQLVGEGLESRGELDALVEMGVTCGQGYFLAVPGPLPASAELL
jgi:EAL domain-containing protein (putative c-di-GMP-specific phosphodiesterase class I)